MANDDLPNGGEPVDLEREENGMDASLGSSADHRHRALRLCHQKEADHCFIQIAREGEALRTFEFDSFS